MTIILVLPVQLDEKKQKSSKDEAQKKEAFKAGRTHGISGREMFTFNPNLMQDDDDDTEAGDVVMVTLPDSDSEVWNVLFFAVGKG